MTGAGVLKDGRATAKRVLLVGMGADIGSNLLFMSATGGFAHPITDVLTHPIESDGVGAANRGPMEELKVRLILANPHLIDRITIDSDKGTLAIDDRAFRIHFRDIEDDLASLGFFDLAVLATSRRHIRSRSHLDRLEAIARVVIGVAENSALPALYPALLAADPRHFRAGHEAGLDDMVGSYAMGSCQCVGWTTGLRVLADYCSSRDTFLQDILIHSEVDIVHPDTASSGFGTKRVGSRTEDPRDNLRPGVSQVAESMLRFPPATTANNVSLRTLTQPPGYQIQRYFVQGLDVCVADLTDAARALEAAEPTLIRVVDTPVGSRAYVSLACGLVLIATDQHVTVRRLGGITEIVFQAFVHNTLGYCATILSATDRILFGGAVTCIHSHHEQNFGRKYAA